MEGNSDILATSEVSNDNEVIIEDTTVIDSDVCELCGCASTPVEVTSDLETIACDEDTSKKCCGCETSTAISESTTTTSVSKRINQTLVNGKKPKLRTSKDVYDRLKWDSESILIKSSNNELEPSEVLDISTVYIGYKDRFLGICELPFEEFMPGGEIPFHRLYYFRTGGPPILPFIGKDGEVKVREDNLPEGAVFIWDRNSRIDRIFLSGNPTIPHKKPTKRPT